MQVLTNCTASDIALAHQCIVKIRTIGIDRKIGALPHSPMCAPFIFTNHVQKDSLPLVYV